MIITTIDIEEKIDIGQIERQNRRALGQVYKKCLVESHDCTGGSRQQPGDEAAADDLQA